jgi:3-oxoacyl-[acyl-carrier-protein] synthase II
VDRICKNCQEKNNLNARYCQACGKALVPPQQLRDLNRVVITGMGVVSCFGMNLEENWKALQSGTSGAGLSKNVPNIEKYECNFSCQVKGFDPNAFMDRKDARRMTTATQYAVAAAQLAYQDACLGSAVLDTTWAGVVIGTAAGGSITNENAMRFYQGEEYPHLFNQVWPNLPAFSIARNYNFTGYNATIVTAWHLEHKHWQ